MKLLSYNMVAKVLSLGSLLLVFIISGSVIASSTNDGATSPAKEINEPTDKPRVVVTTDPELDDLNSLIRFLLYAADFEVEALIYASSQFHWKGDGKGTKFSLPGREYTRFGLDICPCVSWRWGENERFIDDAVDAYTKVYPNLKIHDDGYPSPDILKSRIYWGNVEFDSDISKESPGSNRIKELLLDGNEAPVYLHAWGGLSTIARALKSIEEEYKETDHWDVIRRKVSRKAVIHPSGEQDNTYREYIKPRWPDIRYRELKDIIPLGYIAAAKASAADAVYYSSSWTARNISGRGGALGSLYRVWGDGKQMVKGDIFDYFWLSGFSAQELKDQGYIVWTPPRPEGSFISEGDTATFLNLVNNGLQGYKNETFGGWGGIKAPAGEDENNFGNFEGLEASHQNNNVVIEDSVRNNKQNHRFLETVQRDFAARMAWADTSEFDKANHHPGINLLGSNHITAVAGERVTLTVKAVDPDGDSVSIKWWRWDEVDSYRGALDIEQGPEGTVHFVIPDDVEAGQNLQIIAEATDTGTPSLVRYERVVVTLAEQ